MTTTATSPAQKINPSSGGIHPDTNKHLHTISLLVRDAPALALAIHG
jgi:hypothetical protein